MQPTERFKLRLRIEVDTEEDNRFTEYDLTYFNLSYKAMHELQKAITLKLLELGDNNCR